MYIEQLGLLLLIIVAGILLITWTNSEVNELMHLKEKNKHGKIKWHI